MKIFNTTIEHFQKTVWGWINDCFGDQTAKDPTERNWRFLEESLELVQSLECSAEDAHKMVNYVFDREKGEPHQEVGGVMVTLSALCSASGIDLCRAALDEAERIHQPDIMNRIRSKHAAKPHKSPLPGDYKFAQAEGEE